MAERVAPRCTGIIAESGKRKTESWLPRQPVPRSPFSVLRSPFSVFRFPFSAFRFPLSAYFTTSFLYAVPLLVLTRTM